MSSPVVIDIKPHRYGWACALPTADEHVFVLKPHAIRFAQRQCIAQAAEIVVRNRHGVIERTLHVDPQEPNGPN
ncbi:MAG: hypothetical protein ABI871_00900 [Chthoniobacterales bacterium]